MYRALLSAKKFPSCIIINERIRIRGPNSSVARNFSSEKDDFISVVGEPRIRSPFDNPRKVTRATPIYVSAHAQFTTEGRDDKAVDVKPLEKTKPAEKGTTAATIKVATRQPVSDEELLARTAAQVRPPVEHHQTSPTQASSAADEVPRYDTASAVAANRRILGHFRDWAWEKIPDDLPESEKKKRRLNRNTKLGFIFISSILVPVFGYFCYYYGRARRDESGSVVPDEFSGSLFAPLYRIMNGFKFWRDYVVEPSRELLLPDPLPAPYHQPKYTLVIEMKNILVAPEWTYKSGYRFKKRPALDYFLDVVGYPNFEVVIYTSESSMTAPPIVESMDPKHRIMYKLYRDCTKYMKGHHVKDLSRLNRDLTKVIYIDFDPNSFQLNPENVLRVPKWDGNMDDSALVDLAELLKTIHLSDVDDVRPTLQYYSQFDDPSSEFRRRAQYLAEQEAQKDVHVEQESALKKYSGKLFGFRRHQAA